MQSGLGAAGGPQNAKPPDLVAGALGVQVKLDAGTRNRRSQYIAVAI
jgi:hypothetical protein